MLKLSDVCKTFNAGTVNENRVLSGLNLHIAEGGFVTVVGGNGSGKSTTLNIIAGVYGVDSGKVIIGGADVTDLSEYKRARYLGRVFQDPMMGTASYMSIEENLALAFRRGKTRGLKWCVSKKERKGFQEALSELGLGLEDRMAVKVGFLSGGQRQALTLLMATLTKPKLLLLDEHTAALDPKTAENVLRLTDKIIKNNGLTALMITHNMRDAIKYGDRVIMMNEGNIVFEADGAAKAALSVKDMIEKFTLIV